MHMQSYNLQVSIIMIILHLVESSENLPFRVWKWRLLCTQNCAWLVSIKSLVYYY